MGDRELAEADEAAVETAAAAAVEQRRVSMTAAYVRRGEGGAPALIGHGSRGEEGAGKARGEEEKEGEEKEVEEAIGKRDEG